MEKLHKPKMTLKEIIANPDLFLDEYHLREDFEQSGYEWDELMEIAKQFDEDRENKYPQIVQKYITEIAAFEAIHSYRFRIKETDSFIKKLIIKASKKGKKVTIDDYSIKITDLLGIRVLYVFKEDYYLVHEQIMSKYAQRLVENVHIKLQTGDDVSIYEKISSCDPVSETNSTYRSIHYTLCADDTMEGVRLEIQTRTIFEEAWSEINHKLVYKNQDVADYLVLLQMSKVLSTLVGNCDEIGMLMKNIHDEYIERIEERIQTPETKEYSSEVMKDVLNDFLMNQ